MNWMLKENDSFDLLLVWWMKHMFCILWIDEILFSGSILLL